MAARRKTSAAPKVTAEPALSGPIVQLLNALRETLQTLSDIPWPAGADRRAPGTGTLEAELSGLATRLESLRVAAAACDLERVTAEFPDAISGMAFILNVGTIAGILGKAKRFLADNGGRDEGAVGGVAAAADRLAAADEALIATLGDALRRAAAPPVERDELTAPRVATAAGAFRPSLMVKTGSGLVTRVRTETWAGIR